MTRFDLSGHPSLDAKARKVHEDAPDRFAQEQLQAETLLGVGALPPTIPAPRLALAVMAVCLQINWQLERGIDPLLYQAKGSKVVEGSVRYRESTLVDPRAAAVMHEVAGGTVGSYGRGLRSLRGGGRPAHVL